VIEGVYPRCSSDGENLNTKRRKKNVNNKDLQKGKDQVNGQTYDWDQMPTANNNKGFVHVVRSPNTIEDKHIFEIIISGTVSIYIEYKNDPPSESIEKFVTHVLQNHTPVRVVKGESGTIAAAGKRFDITSATVIDYVPFGENNSLERGRSPQFLMEASTDLHHDILKSGIKDRYNAVLRELKKKRNTKTYNNSDDDDGPFDVIPSYSVSRNLNNSLHKDKNDDSISFALFYVSSTKHSTKTWLLFPDYGIAIEIDQHVLISWDGSSLRHCSCTGSDTSNDIGSVYSMFAGAKKDVSHYYKVENDFRKKGHHKNLKIGETVYVRERLCNMKDKFQYTDPNSKLYPKKFMHRPATVLKLAGKIVHIQFQGKLSKLNGDDISFEVSILDVCRKQLK